MNNFTNYAYNMNPLCFKLNTDVFSRESVSGISKLFWFTNINNCRISRLWENLRYITNVIYKKNYVLRFAKIFISILTTLRVYLFYFSTPLSVASYLCTSTVHTSYLIFYYTIRKLYVS